MGDIADLHYDIAAQQREDAHNKFIIKEISKKYSMGTLKWPTKDNGEILVNNMTKNHLTNAIILLKKNDKSEILDKWMELLCYELEKR